MKWTALRLNMLPITAVEIQYAIQTLTNIHNALVDANSRQSLKSIENFHIKPYFTPSQTFLSQSASRSSLSQSNKKVFQNQPMTYEKLFQQYQRLREQMSNHVSQLKKFYARNSQDESASLFHMLRLKLERCLFDCNFQQDQTKKVMTKSQQEMKYHQIAQNFESNRSKSKLQSISQTQKQFLQSCQTFKTEKYTGYENESIEASKNQFLQFGDQSYEELFHQDKVQNKKQYSKQSLNLSLQKRKNSISNTKRNSKQVSKKVSISKIPLKRQPNSQLTIATLNQRQLSSEKIGFTNIQNGQKNYKNLKVLTNNNSTLKSTIKPNEISPNFSKQSILTKQNSTSQNFNQSNLKNNKNQKAKGYAALNQKKEQQNKVSNAQQKQKIIGKNQGAKQNQLNKNNFKKTQINSSTKNTVQKPTNLNVETERKLKNTNQIIQQQAAKPADNNDLKEILMSKGSQLRFTIKMSREQYKSLLQLKSKMSEKKSN